MVLAFALLGPQPKPPVTQHTAVAVERTCASVARTGTFRVVTKRQGSSAVGLGLVVLENIDGCLEATFITDDAGPAVIEDLSASTNSLKGSLKLSSGLAKLTLQFVGTNVAGSIVEGRNQWTVEGRKTS
jgi:hypothetical protein